MQQPLEEKIAACLKETDTAYETVKHQPVYTNPDMAKALKVKESETVKSLVLNTKENEIIVMVMPGDKKANWKRIAAAADSKKVSFAEPDAVKQHIGCEVGCVPPFGHLTPIRIFMDRALMRNPYVYFNPGVHDKSFKIASKDLENLCRPIFVE
ncbi:MAG: YbaK/EbsC family protein [Desulfobacterales bacterium]